MPREKKLCVVGCGLMGGSLILSLQGQGYTIWAVDTDRTILDQRKLRSATWRCTSELDEALAWADIVVLCTMPLVTLDIIREHASSFSADSIVTDFCGIKTAVMDAVEEFLLPHNIRYVGAHPMTGKERGSFFNASSDLYVGANALVCPSPDSSSADTESIRTLLRDAGCQLITVCTVDQHDKMISFTSQMMHILAVAIANHPQFIESFPYEGGSLRDFTRIATLDTQMWGDLFQLNSEHLVPTLKSYVAELASFIDALESGDTNRLKKKLMDSNTAKDRWHVESH